MGPKLKAVFALEGWLVSDDGSVKLNLGILEVDEDGNVSHTFTSPDGENLIGLYDKLVITVEPVPDPDPGPSALVYAIHTIPSGALNHIRHLLFWWPPKEGEKGILTNLKEQLGAGIAHANLSLGSNDLDGVKKHAHHVVNILKERMGPTSTAPLEIQAKAWIQQKGALSCTPQTASMPASLRPRPREIPR